MTGSPRPRPAHIDSVSVGDTLVWMLDSNWRGAWWKRVTVTKITKTTLQFEDASGNTTVLNVNPRGHIGHERGGGRVSTWETRPHLQWPEAPEVLRLRKRIRDSQHRQSVTSALNAVIDDLDDPKRTQAAIDALQKHAAFLAEKETTA